MDGGVLPTRPPPGAWPEEIVGTGQQRIPSPWLGLRPGREPGPPRVSGSFMDSFLLFSIFHFWTQANREL